MRRTAEVLAAISMALLVTGCTDTAAKQSSQPPNVTREGTSPLRWHDCSADIEASFLSEHRCGTLVVPQDRHDGGAGTLDLAVIQVWPSASSRERA